MMSEKKTKPKKGEVLDITCIDAGGNEVVHFRASFAEWKKVHRTGHGSPYVVNGKSGFTLEIILSDKIKEVE